MTDNHPNPASYPPGGYQPAVERPAYSGYPGEPQTASAGLSIASLVIGLISVIAGFSVILPLVGVVLGIMGLKREPKGRGMAIAGIWINSVILALVFIGLLIALIALIGFGALAIPFVADRSSGVGETIQAVLLFSSARGSV